MVIKLEGDDEIAFARYALTILEGNFIDVLKRTSLVGSLVASTSRQDVLVTLIAMFDAADLLTREQLGVPPKPDTPPGLRTQ